jgi:predicted Ser/Thr protein kinase
MPPDLISPIEATTSELEPGRLDPGRARFGGLGGPHVTDDSATGDHITRGPLGTWGPLQLLEEVGRGGFGTVYRAWEPVLAREVALKVIRPRETRAEDVQAVLREGRLLARVRHHNVVTVHGALQVGDEIGLWMEFVRGRSLADLVAREGRRAASEAALVGVSLCQALAAVHLAGVIHRDIKAQNVMREAEGRIVLMDFGAGQMLTHTGSRREHVVGTPAYMAPEVLAGRQASVVSDVYSLGVLLYFLVTGTYPVEGKTWTDFLLAHSRAERRPLGDLRPDAPADFVRTVEKATALKPEDRFQTSGALLAALTEATARPAPAPSPLLVTPEAERMADAGRDRGVTIDRRIVLAASVVGGIWVLGAVTSVAFNHTLGRSGEFATESVLSWWIWGVRALIPGAVHVTIVLLGLWAIKSTWQLMVRAVPPARRAADSGTTYIRAAAERTGFDDPTALAQVLLVLQVIAIAAFCWHFSDIFSAMVSFVETASPEDLEPMRPEHLFRHQMYNYVMAMLILAMSVGSVLIRRLQRGSAATRSWRPFGGNLAAMAVAFVVLVLPYRLLWQNEMEVAVYQGLRCYILADNGPSLRLYCPASDVPRTKRVAQVDPALTRSGQFENLYTRQTGSMPER